MLIPNSVSGPDISLVNTSGQLYGGDTRQLLEIYVADGAIPMGCAVSIDTDASLSNGQLPIKAELTVKNTAPSASTRKVCGLFAGRVAGASKGTLNSTFLYTGGTTPVPGYHAADGDVVYVVVKGTAYAYVEGTTDVAIGDALDVVSAATITDDGMLAKATATVGGGSTTEVNAVSGFAHRFVALQAQTQAGTAHTGSNVTSTGACGARVIVNC